LKHTTACSTETKQVDKFVLPKRRSIYTVSKGPQRRERAHTQRKRWEQKIDPGPLIRAESNSRSTLPPVEPIKVFWDHHPHPRLFSFSPTVAASQQSDLSLSLSFSLPLSRPHLSSLINRAATPPSSCILWAQVVGRRGFPRSVVAAASVEADLSPLDETIER